MHHHQNPYGQRWSTCRNPHPLQIRGSELSVERLEEGQDELQSVWVLHGVDEETIARTAVRRIVAADYMQVSGLVCTFLLADMVDNSRRNGHTMVAVC